MAEGQDLCSLMESIRLTNHQTDDERIDQLADALREKLGVDMNKSAYKQLAMQFQQLHLEQNRAGNNPEMNAQTPNRGFRGSVDGRTSSPVAPLTARQPSVSETFSNIPNGRGRSPFRASINDTYHGTTENLPSKSPAHVPGKRRDLSPSSFVGRNEEKKERDDINWMRLDRRSPAVDPLSGQQTPMVPQSPKTTARPPSRTASPRPGLQEEDDLREFRAASPARSPRSRSMTPVGRRPEYEDATKRAPIDPRAQNTTLDDATFQPPSRAASPRPGLQEEDDSREFRAASPARSPHVSHRSDAEFTCSRSSTPISRRPDSEDATNRSPTNSTARTTVKDDAAFQPPTPRRTFSGSSMRCRPDTDKSPDASSTASVQSTQKSAPTSEHVLPDISLPQFDFSFGASETNLKTPRPFFQPGTNFSEKSNSKTVFHTAKGKCRRKGSPELSFPSAQGSTFVNPFGEPSKQTTGTTFSFGSAGQGNSFPAGAAFQASSETAETIFPAVRPTFPKPDFHFNVTSTRIRRRLNKVERRQQKQFTFGASDTFPMPSSTNPPSFVPNPPTVATPAASSSAFSSSAAQARSPFLSPMDVDSPHSTNTVLPQSQQRLPVQQTPPLASPPVIFSLGSEGGKKRGHFRTAGARRLSATKTVHPVNLRVDTTEFSLNSSYDSSSSVDDVPDRHDSVHAQGMPGLSEKLSHYTALIGAKREEGKSAYMTGDYLSSIRLFTDGVKLYQEGSFVLPKDVLAILLSNRAAGLLMVGAAHAAVNDCDVALMGISPPLPHVPFSSDSGLLLKVKIQTRRARALLKQGEFSLSVRAFQDAIDTTEEASRFSKMNHPASIQAQNLSLLKQMATEASLGQADARRLDDIREKISACISRTMTRSSDKNLVIEALGHVNVALSYATASEKLLESKATLLAYLKRWREIAGFCERLAANNVKLEGIYKDDLLSRNPFPGIPPARTLLSDFFGESREEDALTADMKLSSRAVAEAILRIPASIIPFYLRALRLEERYPAADSALRSLEDLIKHGKNFHNPSVLRDMASWLKTERSKLDRTRASRERGDELFRAGDFETAALQYSSCLLIDKGDTQSGLHNGPSDDDAGGRLHAVLHCNRAACLMAVSRFPEAIEDCTKALRIHSRYMKAMLRRARCYMRLQRYQEAISEYNRYVDMVNEVRGKPISSTDFVSPCLFDGPRDVSETDFAQVQKELEDVYKAKRSADAAAREEADRRRDRARWQDAFPGNTGASQWQRSGSGSSNAHQRRDNWYQNDNSRRWDSFNSRGPRSGTGTNRSKASETPRYQNRQQDGHNRQQGGQNRSNPLNTSPGSDPTISHYQVLNISVNATDDEIKKAFRKLALKYHPDKNKDEGAADYFRRAKLAYEVLNDAASRRKYDVEQRLNRMF